jgi:endoglucanase
VHLTNCLSPAAQTERVTVLRDAVVALKANAGTWVYLDAGNPLTTSAATMVTRLGQAGVDRADGFSLDVANFHTTAANIAFGQAISAGVGGKHFVVDTSRNGAGRSPDGQWCNPPGRALGAVPAVAPGPTGLLDAVVWVKTPGQSDGLCNGGPASGTWWPEYLVGLARQAGW